jgi:hypothetical protein
MVQASVRGQRELHFLAAVARTVSAVTRGGRSRYVPRFWCPLDGTYPVDPDGYLADPQAAAGVADLGATRVLATDELTAFRCLVLLGEPGAGKTRTISTCAPLLPPYSGPVPAFRRDLGLYGSEKRVIADVLESAEVRRWRDTSGDLCLVLDAFDEAQTRIPTLARLFGHYISQWPGCTCGLRAGPLSGPRLSPGQLEQAFGEVGTFELLPLRRSDIASFLPDGADVSAFLDAVMRAHAVPLAVRPLTLGLLTRLFAQAGGFPERAADLYARGLLAVCDEQIPSVGIPVRSVACRRPLGWQ